ncbi:sigma 54-interacting transcriptional regulator [Pendulispora rubella]|uniref:Sigma 54-interacting transcriptional regulator n=1 Tax=Pendulispora rubella TaxID=2741070 RepID=A0ABZ2LF24_9BACT
MPSIPPPPPQTLVHSLASLQAPPTERSIVTWSDAAGEHTAQLQDRTLVGSAAESGIVIADPTVSRLHAEFHFDERGLWVRDLGSRNGTFVENVMVREARLETGSTIRMGGTTLKLGSEMTTDGATPLWPAHRFGPLVGGSVVMRQLFACLAKFAVTDLAMMIQGETGTGKELVARAIHDASPRKQGPFVIVDCAAVPDALFESELFGHVKGAFTSAVANREGAFEAADGGTVFLDEIGELPIAMQPKLLRVLESRTVRPVGSTEHRRVDVRIVCATHRDLRTMVNAGAFREDLYFRLAGVPILVPPLREHPEDIPLLVEHILGRGASAELLAATANRPWLGNVRELRNFVERARAVGAQQALQMASQQSTGGSPSGTMRAAPSVANTTASMNPALLSNISFQQSFREFRDQWLEVGEREYLSRVLAQHARSIAAAARQAGLDRTYMHRLVRKHLL